MPFRPNKTQSRIRFSTHGLNWGLHALVLGVAILIAGCRASPASLAIMLIGDAVSDADVQDRAEKLVGKPATAADAMLANVLTPSWRRETELCKCTRSRVTFYRRIATPWR